jgi:hypothetical protein
MSGIIKLLEDISEGLARRYIFGLNIFHVNKVDCPILENPELDFLRRICFRYPVSVNTGNIFDVANELGEIFDKPAYGGEYEIVNFGPNQSELVNHKDWPTFPPLFFPRITSEWIDLTRKYNGESQVYLILYADAATFFIAPKRLDSIEKMSALLKQPAPPRAAFLNDACGLFEIVIMTGGDGDFFSAYAKSAESFTLLEGPLDETVKLIEGSAWYNENRSALAWDGEYCMCLVQPENK